MTTQNPFEIIDPTLDPVDPAVGTQVVQPVAPTLVQQASTTTGSAAVPPPATVVVPILPPAPAPPVALPANAVQVPTVAPPLLALPEFEGEKVDRSHCQVTGRAELNIDEHTLMLDDVVRLVGTFRVISVGFRTDPKTGDMVRTHLVKPVEDLSLTPWDPKDLNDKGIEKARKKP